MFEIQIIILLGQYDVHFLFIFYFHVRIERMEVLFFFFPSKILFWGRWKKTFTPKYISLLKKKVNKWKTWIAPRYPIES